MTLAKSITSFLNLKEIQFMVGTAGIYGCYIYYGIIQEMM